MNELIDIETVKAHLVMVHGELALLDRDVATFYGVETKAVNQAVRNNPDKFPAGFVVELSKSEIDGLRSKILTANISPKSRVAPKVFTERGLYMLATILKSKRATEATLAIVNAYAQLRSMVRDMEALQSLKDGSPEQARQLTATGHKLAKLIGENLSTDSTETTIELNLAVLKITHKFTRKK